MSGTPARSSVFSGCVPRSLGVSVQAHLAHRLWAEIIPITYFYDRTQSFSHRISLFSPKYKDAHVILRSLEEIVKVSSISI